MPFVKANPKEDKKKLWEENPQCRNEFEVIDIQYALLREAIKLRKQEKMTQEEIAQKSGLSQQAISKIENLGVEPTLKNFIKYIDAAGLQLILQKKSTECDGQDLLGEVACSK